MAEMLNRIRRQLYDRGVTRAEGLLIAGGHGEYEPTSRSCLLHCHMFACGEMVEAVEELRRIRTYRPTAEVAQPFRAMRVGDPAAQITYVLQSWWPSRRIGPVGEDGLIRRTRQKSRIPEPDHTLFLLWLDRQSLSTLSFVIGGTLKSNGVVVQNRDG